MSEGYDNTNTGALFNNTVNKREGKKDPDYKGRIDVNGVDCWLSGWINTSKDGVKYLALKATPKVSAQPLPVTKVEQAELSDDIPF